MAEYTRRKKLNKSDSVTEAQSVPINAIIAYYGGEVKEGNSASIRCPMHNDSRRSAVVNTYDNLIFCHTCGKGGNAVNIVMILENMEFKDGLKRAVEIATGSGHTIRSGNNTRSAPRARRTWDI